MEFPILLSRYTWATCSRNEGKTSSRIHITTNLIQYKLRAVLAFWRSPSRAKKKKKRKKFSDVKCAARNCEPLHKRVEHFLNLLPSIKFRDRLLSLKLFYPSINHTQHPFSRVHGDNEKRREWTTCRWFLRKPQFSRGMMQVKNMRKSTLALIEVYREQDRI